MRILSWNVNGLRSVYKKGFLEWLRKSRADIVCLQEIKAKKEELSSDIVRPKGYYAYFNSAYKKGYAGVAVYSKKKPIRVKRTLGLKRFDREGRILKLDYPYFTLINLYFPHGGRRKENLAYKLNVYRKLLFYLRKNQKEKMILAGDFNIAHKEIDLARPKDNKNNIMFTPEERKQIDKIIEIGFVDTFRKFHKEGGHYTWWPYFANARERNLGWRIDYIFVSRTLAHRLKKSFILRNTKGSDHCPVGVEIGVNVK